MACHGRLLCADVLEKYVAPPIATEGEWQPRYFFVGTTRTQRASSFACASPVFA